MGEKDKSTTLVSGSNCFKDSMAPPYLWVLFEGIKPSGNGNHKVTLDSGSSYSNGSGVTVVFNKGFCIVQKAPPDGPIFYADGWGCKLYYENSYTDPELFTYTGGSASLFFPAPAELDDGNPTGHKGIHQFNGPAPGEFLQEIISGKSASQSERFTEKKTQSVVHIKQERS